MPAFQPLSSSKRKHEDDYGEGSCKRVSLGSSSSHNRTSTGAQSNGKARADQVWMVQWRAPQQKKHKTWDGDGVLVVGGNGEATLYDTDGKIMGSGRASFPLSEGKNFLVGGRDIELDCSIPTGEFLSGACFGRGMNTTGVSSTLSSAPAKQFNPPSFKPSQTQRSHQVLEASGSGTGEVTGATSSQEASDITNAQLHWTANWRKPQGRKNKTWDGDAYVSLVNDKLVMLTEDGKIMGSAAWKGQALHTGYSIMIGGKEVELDVAISASQLPATPGQDVPPSDVSLNSGSSEVTTLQSQASKPYVAPATFYASTKPKAKGPRHDPDEPDALVMKAPGKDHIRRFNKKNLPVVPVVIDPVLSRKMRPHQKDGVRFLYECVMGMRKYEGQGCILADEMGLGKTLQTIALVWTLLRQNPYAGPFTVVQKVLIVCPVSLINNWKAEFHKWLGRDRVGIITCDKSNSSIDMFGNSKVNEILIIGYERLRGVIDKLSNIYPPIGLIICDEGHRLKSANNKTAAMFKALDTRRRVILSGTPIQNDLGEFHAMADFCNPGLLDDYSVFRKVYEAPILKSRSPDATQKEVEIGEARTAQLLSISKSFVLRRDACLLKNHLPPKTEYVVFVKPTPLQLAMFSKILQPAHLDNLLQSSTAESLALINILTKISNSPILLKASADKAKGNNSDNGGGSMQKKTVQDALLLIPERAHVADMTLSGKLILLSKVMKLMRQRTEEKCVLVSHYTSTLNILEAYCKKMSYSYYRLDGQTPQNKRQEYVNAFNKGSQQNSFVFLLSSKAGGVGINLIGASRLFIVDSDWNPSHDLQSMARCHRDGQKRPVFIYRLLTSGTIDEKIYQRQVTKLALSDSLIGSGTASSKSDSFTRKDLRDIFRVDPDTGCNTHDLLQCDCETEGETSTGAMVQETEAQDPPELTRTNSMGFVAASEVTKEDIDMMEQEFLQKKKEALAALGEWKHLNCLKPATRDSVQDDILRNTCYHPTMDADRTDKAPEDKLGLLSRVDLDVIQAMNAPSIRDVPGGTISFLFEKCSTSNLDNDE